MITRQIAEVWVLRGATTQYFKRLCNRQESLGISVYHVVTNENINALCKLKVYNHVFQAAPGTAVFVTRFFKLNLLWTQCSSQEPTRQATILGPRDRWNMKHIKKGKSLICGHPHCIDLLWRQNESKYISLFFKLCKSHYCILNAA